MSEQIPKNLKPVGRIHSTQGLRGEVFVIFSVHPEHWLDRAEKLYLGKNDQAKPDRALEVVRFRPHTKQGLSGWALLFKDIPDKNHSDLIVKHTLFADPELFVSAEGENVFLSELLDFLVVDKTLGDVGPVIDFANNGGQDLLIVLKDEEEYQVPLVKTFIEKVDFKNKKIFMDLPEGLFE